MVVNAKLLSINSDEKIVTFTHLFSAFLNGTEDRVQTLSIIVAHSTLVLGLVLFFIVRREVVVIEPLLQVSPQALNDTNVLDP